MRTYQSLADASLYRTIAIVPEQVMFGLVLAKASALRDSQETRRNLELGQLFCQVFLGVSEEDGDYMPKSRAAAAIAAGIRELPDERLDHWRDPIKRVSETIADLLEGKALAHRSSTMP